MLADFTGFVFDVDGTLVLSEDPNSGRGEVQPLPGAGDVLRALRSRDTPFVCFTNGTGRVPRDIAAKLRSVGLDVADAEVLTPAVVAAKHILRHYPDQQVLAFGTEGVLEPLTDAGIGLIALDRAEDARVVLIGADPEFTYAKLEAACRAVWLGATLLVTSMAAYFPSIGGRMPSTSGAIAAGIRHVTGVEPTVVGKPSPLVLEVAANVLGARPSELAIVGDDLRLEMRMAREAGAYSVLVLSGSSHEADLSGLPVEHQPNLVVPVIGDLLEYLR